MNRGRPRCPVSRSTDVVALCEVDGYAVWRCPASATDFVWPAPNDDELKRFYDRTDWFEGGERGGYASYDTQTVGSLPMIAEILDGFPAGEEARYVLDVGCGYGTHLALAADRGWKCFGVELSDHARGVAIERHGHAMTVVPDVESLVPHAFDLVLMLDVIEHVADPYALFFRLFNRGLIGPNTRLVVTTPNARADDAVRDPAHWQYRHPPSHLVYYSARSLRQLLDNLLFADIRVRGTSPLAMAPATGYADEALAADEALRGDAGLLCVAEGSHFFGFMQERYVPGTWSKLAEYEHLPRYQFASRFVAGRTVLDFGCGTGYGSRLLADSADHVTGLDIDAAAIAWASLWHDPTHLTFDRRDDLGAGLPAASFDLVTCFEMIEHVDHAMQLETVRNIARLLKPEGRLVISTPNPAVTANYGENPYHLREMDEATFLALLSPAFAHVTIMRQWIRPSVAIGAIEHGERNTIVADVLPAAQHHGEPAAYVAICSQQPIDAVPAFITFDAEADYVLVELRRQQAETALRLDTHALRERALDAGAGAALLRSELDEVKRRLDDKDRGLDEQARQLAAMESARVGREQVFDRQADEIDGLKRAIVDGLDVIRIREEQSRMLQDEIAARDGLLQTQGRQVEELTRYWVEKEATVAVMQKEIAETSRQLQEARNATAESTTIIVELERHNLDLSASLQTLVARVADWEALPLAFVFRRLGRAWRRLRGGPRPPAPPERTQPPVPPVEPVATFDAYAVKVPAPARADRPRVLHAIANFMTGGSSRLVVDLIERLGADYDQQILTSFAPKPAHYLNLAITERPMGVTRDRIAMDLAAFEPDLVHIHYWGDCDEPWYREVFAAAETLHVPILQNVNTPVAPFTDVKSDHAVFVSAYVQDTFGQSLDSGEVIYPGSDFDHFDQRSDLLDNRCVGMVYRLEADKLNSSAIDVFIRIAQALPDVTCLIVGGGTLLEPFKASVREAGCEASFEFTGYVSYEELPALYARMGLFVAPVWKESFGQVSSFAMNMGMPVIGYDVGAIAEIVADPSLVAPAGDAAALADIAIRLLRDRPLREAVMRANQARAATLFSVEAMVDRYRVVYERMTKGSRPPAA